jgi:hypothetical protein
MNDQQLEAVLRRSLAKHAAMIESGPQWPLPDEDLLGPAPRHGRSWWPVAAAVAAVLAVIGVVVAVRHITSDRHEPAKPVIVTTRRACTIDPPPAWQHAIQAASRRNFGTVVLGGAADGTILVRREGDTMTQTVLVSPDGVTRIVEQRPNIGRYQVGISMVDSRWIVLPILDRLSDFMTPVEFDVFDRATLQLTEKVSIAKGTRTGVPVLFGGHLYWTQPRSGSTGSLLDYDLAAHTTRTAEPDGVRNLLSSPAGVAWTDGQNRRHLLAGTAPEQVPGQSGTHPGLVTDGPYYAWRSGSSIVWHNAATKQTVVVRWFPRFDLTVLGVAGPYVLITTDLNNNGRTGWLIDTRTGAAASSQWSVLVAQGNSILAYSDAPVVGMHLDQLPQLSC